MDFLFCYHIVLMLVATIAAVLLVVGFSTPGWLLVTFERNITASQYTVSSLNRSLWYDIVCPRELRDCMTCTHSKSLECVNEMGFIGYSSHYNWVIAETEKNDKASWGVWQGLETAVVVCTVVGFILVICLVCCLLQPTDYKIITSVACILWGLAGLLVWPVVGMVVDMHMAIDEEINGNILHDAYLDVPYSLVLSAVGAFLAIVTAIMLFWLVGVCRRGDDDVSTTLVDDRRSKHTSVLRSSSYHGPYGYYPPEMPGEYRDPPQRDYPRDYSRDYSVTTDEEFYVVDSPYYVPAYYNRYYGADFYDKRRRDRPSDDSERDGRH